MSGGDPVDGPYTEEQWKAIFSDLPSNVDEQKLRTGVWATTFCLLSTGYAMPPMFESDLRGIAKAARRLHMAIIESDVRLLLAPLLWPSSVAKRKAFGHLVEWLPEIADNAERAADFTHVDVRTLRKANNIDFERDAYLSALLRDWVSAGGELGTSYSPATSCADGKPTGPVIRFLLAAAGPPLAATGRKLTKHALRAFVKKVRFNLMS